MNRITLLGTFIFLSLFSSSIVKAQTADTAKVRLAVLPFVSSPGALISNPGDVGTIQETVTAEFTSLSRFMVLDRSKFQKIIDELHIQSSEQFLNGQIDNNSMSVVHQGGGAILNYGTLTLNSCVLVSNHYDVSNDINGGVGGGAIRNQDTATLTMNYCELDDNHADNGRLTSRGYTIRHIETGHRDGVSESFVVWEPPEITEADLPY